MNQDKQGNDRAIRRSRKDQQGRDYICGCGKKYLSYPALYTHIKTKHDGYQPQGTQKTGNGAPLKKTKPKFQQELLNRIHHLMQKQDLTILKQLPNCSGSISIQQRLKKQNLPKQVYQYYSNNNGIKCAWKLDKSMNIQAVLLLFLLSAGQHVCEPLHQVLVQFCRIVLNCFNDYGGQIFESVFKQKVSSMKSAKQFSNRECRYIPIICDFMIRFYIPSEYRQADRTIMEMIFLDFAKWMKKRNMTSIEVRLKKKLDDNKDMNNGLWKSLKQFNNENNGQNQNQDDENQQASSRDRKWSSNMLSDKNNLNYCGFEELQKRDYNQNEDYQNYDQNQNEDEKEGKDKSYDKQKLQEKRKNQNDISRQDNLNKEQKQYRKKNEIQVQKQCQQLKKNYIQSQKQN